MQLYTKKPTSMKYLITKSLGRYADEDAIGKVHLAGPIDSYACGLADEDYISKETTKPVTCTTCLQYLAWAKKIAKLKNDNTKRT